MAPPRPPWLKVLYVRQPYEDSYVGDTFLDSLVLNANLQQYEYLALCRSGMAVVQQLSLVGVFVGVWSRVQGGLWSHGTLLAAEAALLALGYALALACGRWRELQRGRGAFCDLWRGACAVAPLWVMAPMLRTLTRSWSDDTIATMTFGLLAIHAVLYDYGVGPAPQAPALPSGAVALNAAMLAATILASRLDTADQVFAFMSFAMEVFAFFPQLSLRVRRRSPAAHVLVFTPLLALAAAWLLAGPLAFAPVCQPPAVAVAAAAASSFPVGALFAALFAAGFVCPALLIWAQRYKKEIQGPWDIAHVAPASSGDAPGHGGVAGGRVVDGPADARS